MLKRILTLFILITTVFQLSAQQLPSFALYRHNWNLLNPAAPTSDYLFSENPISVSSSFRNQFAGFGLDESPWSGVVNGEYVLDYQNIITGAHIVHDQTGKISQTGLYGRFAYRVELGRRRTNHFVSFGLNAGIVNYRARLSDIQLANPSEVLFDDNAIHPDFSLGVFYYHQDKFYAGFSIPQTFGINTRFRNEDQKFQMERVPHYYLMGGAFFDLYLFNSDAAYFEPSAFIRYVPNAPLSADLNLHLQLNEVFWVGAGGGVLSKTLRFNTGLVIGEAMSFDGGQIKLGFSYDFPLAPYRQAFGSALEAHIIYSWNNYY